MTALAKVTFSDGVYSILTTGVNQKIEHVSGEIFSRVVNFKARSYKAKPQFGMLYDVDLNPHFSYGKEGIEELKKAKGFLPISDKGLDHAMKTLAKSSMTKPLSYDALNELCFLANKAFEVKKCYKGDKPSTGIFPETLDQCEGGSIPNLFEQFKRFHKCVMYSRAYSKYSILHAKNLIEIDRICLELLDPDRNINYECETNLINTLRIMLRK